MSIGRVLKKTQDQRDDQLDSFCMRDSTNLTVRDAFKVVTVEQAALGHLCFRW